MTMTAEVNASQLADLVKHVQAGNEILLTDRNQPVARLVAAGETSASGAIPFEIRSFTGRRVLTPVITQQELADDLFQRQ